MNIEELSSIGADGSVWNKLCLAVSVVSTQSLTKHNPKPQEKQTAGDEEGDQTDTQLKRELRHKVRLNREDTADGTFA